MNRSGVTSSVESMKLGWRSQGNVHSRARILSHTDMGHGTAFLDDSSHGMKAGVCSYIRWVARNSKRWWRTIPVALTQAPMQDVICASSDL